uniref:Uncharacterized protein n=1 Tax=Mycena chlorophos TaxID=658473 RepID=A0ABQ0M0Z4_MYCCL|nr:predicted protein [Mycena chlorophos]
MADIGIFGSDAGVNPMGSKAAMCTVATSATGTLAMGQGPGTANLSFLAEALSAIVQHIQSFIPIVTVDAATRHFNLAQAAANGPLNDASLCFVDADSAEALCTSRSTTKVAAPT